jgi:hypothetical protein
VELVGFDGMTTDRARVLAWTAYTFAYPLVVNYATVWVEAIGNGGSSQQSRFGTWQRFHDNAESYPGYAPAFSSTWLDLRSEPWVLRQGTATRFAVQTVQSIDLWGLELVREVAPGHSKDASMMFVAPTWIGDVPDGIGMIARGESPLVRLVALVPSNRNHPSPAGPPGRPAPVLPLGKYLGDPTPPPTGNPRWKPWKQGTETSHAFWPCANYALSLTVPHPQDQAILEAIAEIGVVSGRSWDAESLPADIIEAIDDGMNDALSRLMRAAGRQERPATSRVTRAKTDIVGRALSAFLRPLPTSDDFSHIFLAGKTRSVG